MANQHREKLRGVRNVTDELWEEFGEATARDGSDRSAVIRRFMEWYTRRPGTEHPRRPAASENGDTTA
ncbi:hypothetical protein ABT119_05720 [Streptomyces sp. NPDC001910]|uniref:hypothetical protein n=1 Tax=Streptomyces sp. NPDC001910 TaxID=3154403 RepID=UPI00331BE873